MVQKICFRRGCTHNAGKKVSLVVVGHRVEKGEEERRVHPEAVPTEQTPKGRKKRRTDEDRRMSLRRVGIHHIVECTNTKDNVYCWTVELALIWINCNASQNNQGQKEVPCKVQLSTLLHSLAHISSFIQGEHMTKRRQAQLPQFCFSFHCQNKVLVLGIYCSGMSEIFFFLLLSAFIASQWQVTEQDGEIRRKEGRISLCLLRSPPLPCHL